MGKNSIALGIEKAGLNEFSVKTTGQTYGKFYREVVDYSRESKTDIAEVIRGRMAEASKIHFNLDNFDFKFGLEKAKSDIRTNTPSAANEFSQIIGNPGLLKKTTFYLNDSIVLTKQVLKEISKINKK